MIKFYSNSNLNNLTNKIVSWYKVNKRNLPWRQSKDPYKIWVSEIILQQTQIKNGLKYYNKFIKLFPDIKELADSSEENVLKAWQGLGYYNRAINMLQTAKKIAYDLDGNFPNNYDELLKLKGVGDYTASAISSICYNEKKAVVDGNVNRVISRFFDVTESVNTAKGRKKIKKIATSNLPKDNIGDYNQALMDFGSLQCTKNNPKCSDCPLANKCIAKENNIVHLRPVKLKTKVSKIRYFNYLQIKNNCNFIIQKRKCDDIWKRLYEFPLIESKKKLKLEELINNSFFKKFKVLDFKKKLFLVHKLSHQQLRIVFWELHVEKIPSDFKKITLKQFRKYPFPRPFEIYLDYIK